MGRSGAEQIVRDISTSSRRSSPPLTLMTGFGMNVQFPGVGTQPGFWPITAIMAATLAALLTSSLHVLAVTGGALRARRS